VALSAGDFLYPLEPSEAKNTQIAWDLLSGRFGEGDFGLRAYVANSGSIHHGSYSSAAVAYWFVSLFAGFDLLSVRLTPLLFWAAALGLWMEVLRRSLGTVAALLAGVGLTLVPTLYMGFQLTFLGCHPESVLPLAAMIGAWLYWQAPSEGDRRKRGLLLGACIGYALIFSYLLWPFVGMIVALSLIPPLPRPGRRELIALGLGLLLGLWPLWLILGLEGPAAIFASNITERGDTSMLDMALGRGRETGNLWRTLQDNLPRFGMDLPETAMDGCGKFKDYWMCQATTGKLWGGINFEPFAYRIMVFGPLVLLPFSLLERRPALRRLLLLIALGPVLHYLFLAYANPWRADASIPMRYLMPLGLLGFSAPGIAVGLGLNLARDRSGERSVWLRRSGMLLALLGATTLLWLAPPRLIEAQAAVRLERSSELLRHRYVTYYNLGIGTVWADMVDEVNDMIDYRAAQGSPEAFHGFQAGLWGSGRRLALGEGDWHPPPFDWGGLNAGIREWVERNGYREPQLQEDAAFVARNVGWGAGIRADWNVAIVAEVLNTGIARGEWPPDLSQEDFWEGFGTGWGRTFDDVPARVDTLPESIPEAARPAVVRGMKAGRERGAVPEAPRKPIFPGGSAQTRGGAFSRRRSRIGSLLCKRAVHQPPSRKPRPARPRQGIPRHSQPPQRSVPSRPSPSRP
jgi:hypothetical protein